MTDSLERARRLRREATDAERRLWAALRRNRFAGVHFRRQHPIGPYFVDFASLSARVVIEVDGNHHILQLHADARREAFLRARGFRVLRFSNREVLTELSAVEDAICSALHGE
jgi:very-short-patch-repair endonuclease